jgi:hypothetical protein
VRLDRTNLDADSQPAAIAPVETRVRLPHAIALLARARGKYICFLDGDDFILPEKTVPRALLRVMRMWLAAAHLNARVAWRSDHE